MASFPISIPDFESLELRPWRIDDCANLVLYANNPAIAANLTDAFPSPYTTDAANAFIHRVSAVEPPQILAISLRGAAIGSIGLHPKEDVNRLNAELGYFLGEPFWGNGYMTAAVRTMIIYGFDTLPVIRIFARPFPSNLASQRILQKAGMKLEAVIPQSLIKNGRVMDEFIFAIRRH
jgi:[ribosomal protein S5]-alanine N-acetyltransferase